MLEASAATGPCNQEGQVPCPSPVRPQPHLEDRLDGICDACAEVCACVCACTDASACADAVWFIGATHAKTYLSAQENPAEAEAWLSGQECYQGWHARSEGATTEGSLEAHSRLVLLMRKPWSLAKREQFTAVFRRGRGYPGSLIVVRVLRNDFDYSRLGLVVGKQVGGAVERNRAKRLIREAVNIRALVPGWDVVVIARPGIRGAKYRDVEQELWQLLTKAGVVGQSRDAGNRVDSGVPEDNL